VVVFLSVSSMMCLVNWPFPVEVIRQSKMTGISFIGHLFRKKKLS
jgi:hypothetical protein